MREITDDLVHRAARGDRAALNDLFTRLHGDIRKIVLSVIGGGRRDVQATDVVDRVWEKLTKQRDPKWNDRTHFLRFVVIVVRRVLADAPRERRGVTFHTSGPLPPNSRPGVDFRDLDACLKKLELGGKSGPRIAEVVLLRCLTSLTWREIAATLYVSERTVKGDWSFGRVFVQRCLGEHD